MYSSNNSTIYFDESSQLSLNNTVTSIPNPTQALSTKKQQSTSSLQQALPKQKSRIRKFKKSDSETVVSKEFHFRELDKEECFDDQMINNNINNNINNCINQNIVFPGLLYGDISVASLTKNNSNINNNSQKNGCNSNNNPNSVFSLHKKVERVALIKSPNSSSSSILPISQSVNNKNNQLNNANNNNQEDMICQMDQENNSQSLDIINSSDKINDEMNNANNNNTNSSNNNFSFLQVEFEPVNEPSTNFFQQAQIISNTTEDQNMSNYISQKLYSTQESVNNIIYHLSSTDAFIKSNYDQFDIYAERKSHFDTQVSSIIQEQAKNDSTPFFYIKTFVNYNTRNIENKEIGFSKELLNLLKITKNTHEFINTALRGEIPEIFNATFKQQLALYFLENLNNNNTQQDFFSSEINDNIKSFDDIQIPAKLSIQKINIPYTCEINNNLSFIDNYLTIVRISLDSQVRNQITSLRCKLQKRQSFRYRTLFPTMQKRKQKIDKFYKNQQSQLKISQYVYIQNFLEKFYPKQLQTIENELNVIKNDLETNKSQKTVIANLLDHIINL